LYTSYVGSDDEKKVDDDMEGELVCEPPPKEECPICMQPMPYYNSAECGIGKTYMPCCGKYVCGGCAFASVDEMKKGNMKRWCVLCRVPLHNTDEEYIAKCRKRIELNDAEAFHVLGALYLSGDRGLPKNSKKALELWIRASELGSVEADYLLACSYLAGTGIEKDIQKAWHYCELAANGGHEMARYNLGIEMKDSSSMNVAMAHLMIAARCGLEEALKEVGEGYKEGYITKDKYASTLRAYQDSREAMKSEPRARCIKFLEMK